MTDLPLALLPRLLETHHPLPDSKPDHRLHRVHGVVARVVQVAVRDAQAGEHRRQAGRVVAPDQGLVHLARVDGLDDVLRRLGVVREQLQVLDVRCRLVEDEDYGARLAGAVVGRIVDEVLDEGLDQGLVDELACPRGCVSICRP